ncbi:Phospholipid-binding copine family protein [Giardia muris]|uniref:Phospholipid-binding copine family protein n=1 Tax=Giardia muris TaxID=5742 RepID=A0A4Z1T6C0_GIAMU|nr:Phospholipid-binding copine family protein [Giardia muris]|eukprot:TNJ28079.1 Phospholipid-binding copine family protein [Giardia muris]
MGSNKSKVLALTINTQEYDTWDSLLKDMQDAKMEYARFIVAIDFTLSNRVQSRTMSSKSLHDPSIDHRLNGVSPYQFVLEALVQNIAAFNDIDDIELISFGLSNDLLIENIPGSSLVPCYQAHAKQFNTIPDAKQAIGTTIAPVVYRAIECAIQTHDYHILIILTDGDMEDTGRDAQAIIDASNFPISILVVGIGSGPFDTYTTFDNVLFERRFDNLNFVSLDDMIRSQHSEDMADISRRALLLGPQLFSECPAQHITIRDLLTTS